MPDKEIKFYGPTDEYGFFSNFSAHPISLKGKVWPTSEHYYQAQKFAGTEIEEKIRWLPAPGKAFREARKHKLREDWEEVKVDVMRDALLAKFTQHGDLRRILLGTKDALLIEHTPRDSFWGDGGDGSGKNMLGTLLMELREKLRGQ